MHIRLSPSPALAALLVLSCAALPVPRAVSAEATTATDPSTPTKKVKPGGEAKKALSKSLKSGDVGASGTYEMSEDEKAMDCKRLTGSIKITISRLRDAQARKGASSTAEAAHKTVPLIMGGSTASADRQASLGRERAKIDAYNRQLAAKSCKTVDIEAELARAPEGFKKY